MYDSIYRIEGRFSSPLRKLLKKSKNVMYGYHLEPISHRYYTNAKAPPWLFLVKNLITDKIRRNINIIVKLSGYI